MTISQAYGPGKFGLSFELFPPKTPAGEAELFAGDEKIRVGIPELDRPFDVVSLAGGGIVKWRCAILCTSRRRNQQHAGREKRTDSETSN